MKTFIPVCFIVLLLAASCKKDFTKDHPVNNNNNTAQPKQFKEIKASNQFEWKTSQIVMLSVKGMETAIPITNTLIVRTTDGNEIMRKLHQMDQDYLAAIEFENHIKKVVISYGSIVKTIDIVNARIDFDFVTVFPEPE